MSDHESKAIIDYLIIQTSVGDYRQQVMEQLVHRLGESFQVLCGKEYFYPSLKTGIDIGDRMTMVPNRFLLGRKFLWQSNVVITGIRTRHVILEYNPRILSNWIILLGRVLLRKNTALWGHAWSRQGRDAPTEHIRKAMRRLATSVVVYTEKDRSELIEADKIRKIIAAPNSLYRKMEMLVAGNAETRTSLIYVGRLVSEKKVRLLIDAFSQAKLPDECKLLIVGEGPERSDCERLIKARGIGSRVQLFGHIGDPERLKSLYSRAIASVSSGYVGLSITQSLGFGVPMIIANREPHAPEVEAAVSGMNCVFFEADDVKDLSRTIERFVNEKDMWFGKTDRIVEECRNRYSVEVMCEQLVKGLLS